LSVSAFDSALERQSRFTTQTRHSLLALTVYPCTITLHWTRQHSAAGLSHAHTCVGLIDWPRSSFAFWLAKEILLGTALRALLGISVVRVLSPRLMARSLADSGAGFYGRWHAVIQ
jgi:hypothetical protein